MAYLGEPQHTIAVLQKYNFHFQKKFGQNFLIDTHVLERIIAEAGVTKDDFVVEIGPGIGTMTQYLCEAAGAVAAEVSAGAAVLPPQAARLSTMTRTRARDRIFFMFLFLLNISVSPFAAGNSSNGKRTRGMVIQNLQFVNTTGRLSNFFSVFHKKVSPFGLFFADDSAGSP